MGPLCELQFQRATMQLLIFLLACLQLWVIVEPKTVEIDIGRGCRSRRECRHRRWSDRHYHHDYDEKYYVSDFKTTWYRARDYCENRMGMKLLDARDRVLPSSVVSAIRHSGTVDCCYEKKFWTDENKYSDWVMRKVCLYVDWHNNAEFIQGACEKKRYFICEHV